MQQVDGCKVITTLSHTEATRLTIRSQEPNSSTDQAVFIEKTIAVSERVEISNIKNGSA